MRNLGMLCLALWLIGCGSCSGRRSLSSLDILASWFAATTFLDRFTSRPYSPTVAIVGQITADREGSGDG